MPYGISKKTGGDSPANDAHMEKVVAALTRAGHSKVSAIKIAKAQQEKSFSTHRGTWHGHNSYPPQKKR